jgi:hypothetical protein
LTADGRPLCSSQFFAVRARTEVYVAAGLVHGNLSAYDELLAKGKQTVFKRKYLIWCVALVVILACVPSLPVTSVEVPTIDPNAVGTMIMQTAFAASTQTAAALPTATPTASFTPTPRNTDTPEPTATNTIVFILFSPTANISIGSGSGISGGSSSDPYACKVTSFSPASGTSFKPRAAFDARWTITNIGKNKWESNSVDYSYLSGDKIHKVESYDLPAGVEPGGSISIIVEMLAPKDPGSYTTAWSLRVDTNKFCPLILTITVNE